MLRISNFHIIRQFRNERSSYLLLPLQIIQDNRVKTFKLRTHIYNDATLIQSSTIKHLALHLIGYRSQVIVTTCALGHWRSLFESVMQSKTIHSPGKLMRDWVTGLCRPIALVEADLFARLVARSHILERNIHINVSQDLIRENAPSGMRSYGILQLVDIAHVFICSIFPYIDGYILNIDLGRIQTGVFFT